MKSKNRQRFAEHFFGDLIFVFVGRGQNRVSISFVELFGRSVLRCHRAEQSRRVFRLRFVEQFGNSEIEQFRRTDFGYENIRRFQIAVNDQVSMSESDRVADFVKEFEPRV